MNTKISMLPAVILLSACATPVTTLTHAKTKQTVTCGGGDAASYAGGAIGYHIQKNKDADCVEAYVKKGFKVQ